MSEDFSPVDRVLEGLRGAGYLADSTTGTVVHLATELGKPVLVEGPAGTGKTQLAKSAALAAGKPLIRLQCYEGLDESKAIYEWDYRRQLLQLQLHQGSSTASLDAAGIFGEEFLLSRPLLAAIRSEEPVVLLIDEVDRLDIESEALLLEILSDYQVSIPEFGTVTARHIPQVRLHVPQLAEHLATEIAELAALLRKADLKKPPSIAESLDWARTLLTLGATDLSDDLIRRTLSVLLKYERDIDTAVTELRI